ncbi:sensor histidine kinase [Myroides sp. LJL119]
MASNKVFTNHTLFKNTQKLYESLQKQAKLEQLKEEVYQNILNNVDTGILILEKRNQDWSIFLANNYFLNLFEIPPIKSWYNLQRFLPGFTKHIEELDFRESKQTIDISIQKAHKQTFILQTKTTKSQNQVYYIVLLDSIQSVLDKKQRQNWENLMKIISHEIMNSLTPIHSLAHNSQEILKQKRINQQDLADIKISIQTIVNRTNHLSRFIDNYRQLTMLPSPVLKNTVVKDLLQNTINIITPLLKKDNIQVDLQIRTNINMNWDFMQMEQVLINLLTNAIFSVNTLSEQKKIQIKSWQSDSRLYIQINDNGPGIDPQILDKIFIPFFTTRTNGAGIGLPLSKNIVEMHQGYLQYLREQDLTKFCLIFPL